MAAHGQPAAEDLLVEVGEHQPLGATGGGGHHADVLRAQALGGDVLAGALADVDVQCFHGASAGKANNSASRRLMPFTRFLKVGERSLARSRCGPIKRDAPTFW